jgi:hypothetical protein
VTSAPLPIELAAYRVQAETGLSARELAEMDMDEYARVTGRQTPVQAALQALEAQRSGVAPQAPERPQEPAQQSQGIDVASMDMGAYAALRDQLGIGRGDAGMFGSGGLSADAARRQAERTVMSNANVTPPPRLTGRFVNHDEHRDHRTVAERFSTPGNSHNL